MAEPQSSQFWKAALKSGLLEDSALQQAWDEIPAEKRTDDAIDRRLARQVVNSGGLTLWQAQQVLANRWQGLRIDKYVLVDVIGHGGMGRVYLAKDTRLHRQVALKILSRERMNNTRALARFRREAKVGAQLQHENLVRIYDEGESHGVRFLVMEYIEGQTVGRMIAEHGRLPPGIAADITRQVSMGLDHLHQKGLLHRDVNPMNILLDRNGTAKLTDLGLAIDTGDADDIVTRDGATVGTFDYISPEQAKHSRSADARSDVYSLGCSLYHMLTGQVPFPMPSLPEKLYAHQLLDPGPIGPLAPDVPAGLQAIVRKSMRKLPEERFARPVEFARALEPFARGANPQDSALEPLTEGTTSNHPTIPHAPPVSAVTPAGSDPDLDLNRGVAASPPAITPASDPMDFLVKIDFGPDQPLSGTRRPPAPAPDRPGLKKYVPAALIAAAILLTAASIVVAWAWKERSGTRPQHPGTPDRPLSGADKGRATEPTDLPQAGPTGDVAIVFADKQERPVGSLREAIERSAGRERSEIVLRGKTPIDLGKPGKSLMMAWGGMTIRAGGDAPPELIVNLSGKEPWIEVGPQAALKLVGLRVQVEVIEKPGAKPDDRPPTLILSHGNVEFERCTFFIAGKDRNVRVVSAEGLAIRAVGCLFEGFDRPIRLVSVPGGDASFSQCLFVRDATADQAAGWAISAVREPGASAGARKLAMERCTAVQTGLLVVEGFDAANPLDFSLKDSVIKAKAIVMTPPTTPDAIGKLLRWKGQDNWYQVSDASWAVILPQGFAGPAGMPSDLKSWGDRMGNESASREDPITFAGSMQGEGRPTVDFAVKAEVGKPAVGIDPKSVGPPATTAKP